MSKKPLNIRFKRSDWLIIGVKMVALFNKHVFQNGLDVDGSKFKDYSTRGSKWVMIGIKKEFRKEAPKGGYSYAHAKANKMFRRQDDSIANKTAPVLTGDLRNDFDVQSTSNNGFKFGTLTKGAVVQGLANKGRKISTSVKAVPDKVAKAVRPLIQKQIEKKLRQGGKRRKTHKINIKAGR